jgi:UDP:flavonoid glycosyltransferase YjiC (YdhE family)
MRILIISGALYGHVNTLLPIAIAARDAGHSVFFASGPDFAEHVESRGLRFAAAGLSHQQAGGNRQDSWLKYFVTTAERRAADLLPMADRWRPELVIHEETELAGPLVAAKAGARHAVHGLSVMPPRRIWPAFVEAVGTLEMRCGVPDAAARLADAHYLHVCPPALQSSEAASWRHVLPLRPVAGLPRDNEQLPDQLDRMPFPRTIHLTFGTVYSGNLATLEQAIGALSELDANLIVTIGPGEDPSRFGVQASHVYIEPYLPHTQLLPRCDLVVSHGGAGVMFGALSEGIPQLIIPQGADQFWNAEACARSGAALTITTGETNKLAINRAARRLLDESQFAAAADAVRSQIAAMPDAAAVLTQLTQ